jgi:lipopolysaccharide transport system ATP-binding protein
MDSVITVENVGKKYRIPTAGSSYHTLRETVADIAERFAPRRSTGMTPRGSWREFWALRNVSFSVRSGEVVGLIGSNGAGKSTLLKILSRITSPTEGHAVIAGQVGSLLEVGTGFHPELTGRDNIYLNGAVLGMRRKEIAAKFDAIVEFAGVGEFLDLPVKRYSSGMYLRLAFSVAAHLDTDVLFVDEVLSVGDTEFQRRCMGRIHDIAGGGRTVVMVSHNLSAIQGLCSRALLFRKGALVADGAAQQVVAEYLQLGTDKRLQRRWTSIEDAPGGDRARLRSAQVLPTNGATLEEIDVRTPFSIIFEYTNFIEGAHLTSTIALFNQEGLMIFEAGPYRYPTPRPCGTYREMCFVPGDLLNNGGFRVSIAVHDRGETVILADDVLAFEIGDNPDLRFGSYEKWSGVVRPYLRWETEFMEPGGC